MKICVCVYLCISAIRFIALSSGLKENFADVTVDEIECPDLASAPYHLASSGLNGSPTLLEIGGPTYLLPLVDRTKVYELLSITKKVLPNAKSIYVCGAGAGPHPSINSNCEVGAFTSQMIESE